jgi:hypothetical protein
MPEYSSGAHRPKITLRQSLASPYTTDLSDHIGGFAATECVTDSAVFRCKSFTCERPGRDR